MATDRALADVFREVYASVVRQHAKIQNAYYSANGAGIVNLAYMDHFLVLCHRFSHALHTNDLRMDVADATYYSARLRTSTDIYCRTVIGECFLPSHPLGTVIDSKASYGRALRLYNGVHVGPFNIDGKPPSEWVHPVIGDGVILYAKTSIYGQTVIGNNVTVSPGTVIVNESIPNNCIVFGASPNLKVVPNKQDNLAVCGG